MLDFPTWKKVWLWGLTLAVAIAALPSLFSALDLRWPDALPDPTVNLGLDLAGGSHVLLEADASEVRAQRLENFEDQVDNAFRNAEPRIRTGDVSTRDGRLSFMVESAADVDRAREEILPLMNGDRHGARMEPSGRRRNALRPDADRGWHRKRPLNNAMESATDVIRDRINSLGTREPTIIRQGDTRIVVQVPGLDDPAQLKAQLEKQAVLEFKLVDPEFQNAIPLEASRDVTKIGTQIIPYAEGTGQAGRGAWSCGGWAVFRATRWSMRNRAMISKATSR